MTHHSQPSVLANSTGSIWTEWVSTVRIMKRQIATLTQWFFINAGLVISTDAASPSGIYLWCRLQAGGRKNGKQVKERSRQMRYTCICIVKGSPRRTAENVSARDSRGKLWKKEAELWRHGGLWTRNILAERTRRRGELIVFTYWAERISLLASGDNCTINTLHVEHPESEMLQNLKLSEHQHDTTRVTFHAWPHVMVFQHVPKIQPFAIVKTWVKFCSGRMLLSHCKESWNFFQLSSSS